MSRADTFRSRAGESIPDWSARARTPTEDYLLAPQFAFRRKNLNIDNVPRGRVDQRGGPITFAKPPPNYPLYTNAFSTILLRRGKNTTHSENLIFGIQSYFRAQTVALDAN